jgi:hypothetical protein
MARKNQKRLGVVLVFKEGLDRAKAEGLIQKLVTEGYLDTSYYVEQKPTVNEFNPEYGGPVWYIP